MIKTDLTLTIKKKWLNEIVSGRKTEEYRDDKAYYLKLFRLVDQKTFLVKTPPKTLKLFVPYQKHTFYCIVEVKKIRFEQFLGKTKPIPEGFKKGEKAYVIYITKVLEHNL